MVSACKTAFGRHAENPGKQPFDWRVAVNFNNVLIGSEDPARLAAYYSKLFGDPTWSDGGYSTWLLGSGAISVGPHSEVKGKSAHPGRIILNIETDDVQRDFARWRDAGATVIQEPYTFDESPGSWVATFADPDDNYFQLITPMPEAGTERGSGGS
jgi:predicted enzyme related to lactoylglutathione lyase